MKVVTMVELIDDALQYLAANATEPALLLQQLKQEEDADYSKFVNSPLPRFAETKKDLPIDTEILYRQRSLCHTARVPAQARFLGAITNTEPGTPEKYDVGIAMDEAFNQPVPDGGLMPLAFKPAERQKCFVPVNVDYKDMFYVTSKSPGFSKLVLPNDAEKRIYGHGGNDLNGYIAICVSACGFGKVSFETHA